jgi:hypothetical protein
MHYVYMILGALLITLDLVGPVRSVHAETGSETPTFKADCTDLRPVTLPAPGVIPVVVSYMKNFHHPDDDVESRTTGNIVSGAPVSVLSRDRIRRGFEPNGEFHWVWGPLGIRFALVGFRTCVYTLGPSHDPGGHNDPRNARRDIPDPGLNLERVFLKVLEDLNTTEVQADSGKVKFRGLDLYLWWEIEGPPGYGVRPRFGKVNEESGRDDEPAFGRRGAVWLDTKCVGGTDLAERDFCAGLFSHEAGHFLGLCHCCLKPHLGPSAQECFNYLKPGYCPGLPLAAAGAPKCEGELKKRLMSATNPLVVEVDSTEDNLRVEDCEKDTALEGKEKVLRYGGNGISSRR